MGVIAGSSIPRNDAAARGGRGNGGCFLRGSAVLTEFGYRPVETLKTGGRLPARFAGIVPIRSVDSFTLCRTSTDTPWAADETRPVRVRRGALGANMPRRDLCLTAAHMLAIDGMLVPAGDLVNGTSIVWEPAAGQRELEFFHVELARHDLIDVEGTACETLRDPAAKSCLPIGAFSGERSRLYSRLRSAVSVVIDCRRPLDRIRDAVEERAFAMKYAA